MLIWGCPALRAGRAVSQLAIRSALRAFSLRFKSPRSGLRPLLSIPQPGWASPAFWRQKDFYYN
ncbi:hypothetical protein SGRA_3340 [Saprospira grandis str. Lewin]|uniref:Uncharacterized protein n=1 Tax=Saprospira grandis (strain Lewin) TaxID=984262 RepID=H6L131_SAPGL|nr:hypothetical protein SGRA_3340 [Saprospira grandis str. Lewin]